MEIRRKDVAKIAAGFIFDGKGKQPRIRALVNQNRKNVMDGFDILNRRIGEALTRNNGKLIEKIVDSSGDLVFNTETLLPLFMGLDANFGVAISTKKPPDYTHWSASSANKENLLGTNFEECKAFADSAVARMKEIAKSLGFGDYSFELSDSGIHAQLKLIQASTKS